MTTRSCSPWLEFWAFSSRFRVESLGLAVQASGDWADLPGDGASAGSGRQPEAASQIAAQPTG